MEAGLLAGIRVVSIQNTAQERMMVYY